MSDPSRPPIRRWGRLAVACVWLLTLGCTFSRTRTNVDDFYDRIDRVVVGKTTAEQLIDILGSPPNNIIDVAAGRRVLLYTFGDAKTSGLTLIVLNITKTNVGIDSAIFIVDPDNVVEEVRYSTNSQGLEWDWWAFGQ